MTNCFLIADEAARQAVLFDAPDHTVEPLLQQAAARGWELAGLWLTHGHFDHFADQLIRQWFFARPLVLGATRGKENRFAILCIDDATLRDSGQV